MGFFPVCHNYLLLEPGLGALSLIKELLRGRNSAVVWEEKTKRAKGTVSPRRWWPISSLHLPPTLIQVFGGFTLSPGGRSGAGNKYRWPQNCRHLPQLRVGNFCIRNHFSLYSRTSNKCHPSPHQFVEHISNSYWLHPPLSCLTNLRLRMAAGTWDWCCVWVSSSKHLQRSS